MKPELSVVVPVYNEEGNLPELHRRLAAAMDALGRTYELIFVDDGSRDGSFKMLQGFVASHPPTRLVEFNRNYGQHAAVFAGLRASRGAFVITLDADLQNPPEEIPKLVKALDEGADAVGGWRKFRQDPWARKLASWLNNRIVSKATGIRLNDYGCMLRGYRREVVDGMMQCGELSSYIPALAHVFARRIEEVPVEHAERGAGRSKYNFASLLRLQFDILTGFSKLPIRALTWFGILSAFGGALLGLVLLGGRLVYGDAWAVSGTFTLFAVLFFFVGAQFLAFGLLGEYLGRIYAEVRSRPRFLVRRIHDHGRAEESR